LARNNCSVASRRGNIQFGKEDIPLNFSLFFGEGALASACADGAEFPRGLNDSIGLQLIVPVTKKLKGAAAIFPLVNLRMLNSLFQPDASCQRQQRTSVHGYHSSSV
jgi:hypothetical protein